MHIDVELGGAVERLEGRLHSRLHASRRGLGTDTEQARLTDRPAWPSVLWFIHTFCLHSQLLMVCQRVWPLEWYLPARPIHTLQVEFATQGREVNLTQRTRGSSPYNSSVSYS